MAEDTPKYASTLYYLGGISGYEIRAGSRWSPDPQRPGEMMADPTGFYVNNLVLREANRRINTLQGEKGKLTEKVTKLEAEIERLTDHAEQLQQAINTQPAVVHQIYAKLVADPHAAELFGLVRKLATLMSTETI